MSTRPLIFLTNPVCEFYLFPFQLSNCRRPCIGYAPAMQLHQTLYLSRQPRENKKVDPYSHYRKVFLVLLKTHYWFYYVRQYYLIFQGAWFIIQKDGRNLYLYNSLTFITKFYHANYFLVEVRKHDTDFSISFDHCFFYCY